MQKQRLSAVSRLSKDFFYPFFAISTAVSSAMDII